MGLNFKSVPTAPAEPVQEVVQAAPAVVEEVKQYDIVADRQQLNAQLVNSQEVDTIVSTIELDNLESIVSFGHEATATVKGSTHSLRYFAISPRALTVSPT